MDVKTRRFLINFILIIIVIGISAMLGDYAARIMSTSTIVKNAMLCQIIFILGVLAGIIMCLISQDLYRRYGLIEPNNIPGKNPPHEDTS
ncbi:hypothetical protein [Methanoregula sp.]|jgi:hypothetical protein|uniref:hypothetical protein n=1 Tax=Methanoregula sp. TaxID=2052170 RepID=UPI00356B277F